jgi:hypothetical protein
MAKSTTSEAVSATTFLVRHLLVSNYSLFIFKKGNPTKTIELGVTEIPEDMFMELLKDISPRF